MTFLPLWPKITFLPLWAKITSWILMNFFILLSINHLNSNTLHTDISKGYLNNLTQIYFKYVKYEILTFSLPNRWFKLINLLFFFLATLINQKYNYPSNSQISHILKIKFLTLELIRINRSTLFITGASEN